MQEKCKNEAVASRRIEVIGPLLDPNIDPGKFQALKWQIAKDNGLSERTIRRYLKDYKEKGIDGLKTKSRGRCKGHSIPENVLAEAILLRREVPSRSVSQIIEILEIEGMVQPGIIKRSTLQDYFQANGYSAKQMRMYESVSGQATRRFQRRNRNDLWQSDIKYGMYLPTGKNGVMRQSYLVTFLDDATRCVIHAEFYATLDQGIVEDAFRRAIIKWGVPKMVYFDNGKQYRNNWMRRCCERLGIRLLYAKPYAAASKGKVEKFNRLVDNFLTEAHLNKPKTLTELNVEFAAWLSECYQNRPHGALKDGVSPQIAFQSDDKPLRFITPEQLATAFLHYEERRVDKSGCISLKSKKYDVGWQALGKKVTVIYDPRNMDEISISWGNDTWKARELQIGERIAPKPKMPESLVPIKPQESRVLKAAAKKHKNRIEVRKQAISYSSMGEV